MRIAELARRGGVSLPTVKYYLREGLLPPGTTTARNQAEYDDTHLHRLRLVRALLEVGGLRIGAARAVLDALDDPGLPPHELLGVAHRALQPPRRTTVPEADLDAARADVEGLLHQLGWQVSPDAPARDTLAHVLATLRQLGENAGTDTLLPYAEAAGRIAALELDHTSAAGGTRAQLALRVVVGTVVYESALAALRLLAQEHHSARRFPDAP